MTLPDSNQPFHPDSSRLSNEDIEEKAIRANELLHNPVLREALNDIYSRAAGMLMKDDVGSLTAQAHHAMMKAALDIKQQLEQYVSDHKMRQKYHKEPKNG